MSRRGPLLEFALVAVVGLACLGFQLWLPSTHVADADYQAVAQVLAQEAQPGDAVLLAPWWTERARLFVPPSLQVVGYQGSDDDDLELHPRVWVLSEPRLPRADYGGFYARFAPGRTALGEQRAFGNLRLQLFSNGRAKAVRWSAQQLLPQARVYLEGPQGQQEDCPWDGRVHRCRGGYVGLEWREVLFQPRQCLRFYPPGGPVKLVLELNGVPAAQKLAFRGGMTWDRGWFHQPQLTPTYFTAALDGQQVLAVTVPVGLEGLQRADGPAVREGALVRLAVQSDNAELRESCVELYGLDQPGGAQ